MSKGSGKSSGGVGGRTSAPAKVAAKSGPVTPEVFASRVRELARQAGKDARWGATGDRVFIGPLHQAYEKRYGSTPDFKQQLVNARGHIRLSRADLVEAMPRELVRSSETSYLNARWHFVSP